MCKILIMSIIILFSLKVNAQDEFDFVRKSTLSGYGELHYNVVEPQNGQTTKKFDFHRFVIFYGFQWNDKWSFKSEFEVEHNVVEGNKENHENIRDKWVFERDISSSNPNWKLVETDIFED